jgi:hypothetical protein
MPRHKEKRKFANCVTRHWHSHLSENNLQISRFFRKLLVLQQKLQYHETLYFKASQYACAALLIACSIVMVAY